MVLATQPTLTEAPRLLAELPTCSYPLSPAGFRWEADMTEPVVRQLGRLLPRARAAHLVVGEVPAAVGIADIVAITFDPPVVRRRLDIGVGPILSPLRVRTLDLLRPDRPMRLETLARKVGTNPRALGRSTLRPLAEMGLIDLSATAAQSTGAWVPVCAQITAVELKLSKWRRALRQADNLALSADRSWVVLDRSHARAALDSLDVFAQFGVGLAVVDPDGRLRVASPPRGRRPERWLRSLFAERAWAIAEAEVAELAAVA
jgi:hypothetical protein